jgi:lysozyme
MNNLKTSSNGIALIEREEGFEPHPYQDVAGNWTIGIGTICYPDGSSVKKGDPEVTREKAEDFVKHDLAVEREKKINAMVTSTINQNQFDALVSFTYNEGVGALRGSHLLLKINKNPLDPTIKDEFRKWDFAGGKIVSDLKARREHEINLYFSPCS